MMKFIIVGFTFCAINFLPKSNYHFALGSGVWDKRISYLFNITEYTPSSQGIVRDGISNNTNVDEDFSMMRMVNDKLMENREGNKDNDVFLPELSTRNKSGTLVLDQSHGDNNAVLISNTYKRTFLDAGEINIDDNGLLASDNAVSVRQRRQSETNSFADYSREVIGSGDKIPIWLLGLFPFNGSWAGGLGQLPAIEMGIEDVNAHPDILADYTLFLTVNNTAVSVLFSFFPVKIIHI